MFARSLALGVAAIAFASSSAFAADLIIPTAPQPIMESAGFFWDGLYAGVQGGGQFYPNISYGLVGVHVGANFTVAAPVLVGVEGTAEWIFNNNNASFGEFFANGRLGAVVTDSVLVYALVGTGVEVNNAGNTFGTYQLGGGVEFAVTDAVSIRGQLVGVGFYNDGNTNFFDGSKATVGVSYHF